MHRNEARTNDYKLDIVLLIGPDRPGETYMQDFFQEITAICKSQQLKFRILGDGKTFIEPEEIKNIGKTNHLAFYGHGKIYNDMHYINFWEGNISSLGIVLLMQTQTDAESILFCSCNGGKIVDNFEKKLVNLKNGTSLFAPSGEDDVSFQDNNQDIIKNFVKKILPSQNASMISLVADSIKTIPQTMKFLNLSYPHGAMIKDVYMKSIKSFKIARTDRRLYFNINEFYQFQLNAFIQFLKNNHLYENEINSLQLEMQPEEIEAYRELSLINHIKHNSEADKEIIEHLLQQSTFGPELLAITIILHRIQHHHKNMENMVQLILNHLENVTVNQTVNSFAPKNTDWKKLVEKHGKKALLLKFYTPLTLALTDREFKIDNHTLITFVPTNYYLVKTLLDNGADMYLPDILGRVPAVFLNTEFYQGLFVQEMNEAKEAEKRLNCAIILLYALEKSEHLSFMDFYEQVQDAKYNKNEWSVLSGANSDSNLLRGISYPPKNKKVLEAYKNYLEAANNINLKDLLKLFVKKKPECINQLDSEGYSLLHHIALKANYDKNFLHDLLVQDSLKAEETKEEKNPQHTFPPHIKLFKFPAKNEEDEIQEKTSVSKSGMINKK